MAQLFFDATQVAPQESINPIPAGVYLAQAIESDVRPLKSGMGRLLSITFQVLEGQYINRKVFANLNIEHRGSAEAERIAQRQLSALCHAVGMPRGVQHDSSELHMKPLRVRVKIRKDESGQYGDKNEVTGYEAAHGGLPPPAAAAARSPAPSGFPPAGAAQAAPPHAAAAAPWARRPAGAQA